MSQLESFLNLSIIKNSRQLKTQLYIQIGLLIIYICGLSYLYFFTYLISNKMLWQVLALVTFFYTTLSMTLNFRDQKKLTFGHDHNFQTWVQIQIISIVNLIMCFTLISFIYTKKTSKQLLSANSNFKREKVTFTHKGKYSIQWVNEWEKTIYIKFHHSYYVSTLKLEPGQTLNVNYKQLASEHWVNIFKREGTGCVKYSNFLPKNFGEGSIFRLVYGEDETLKNNAIEVKAEYLTNNNCRYN